MKKVLKIFPALLILLVFIGFGLIIILINLNRTIINTLYESAYQVKTGTYSIAVLNSSNEEIFKISPLDDFYYHGLTKDHLSDQNSFKQLNPPTDKLLPFLNDILLGKRLLLWRSTGKDKIQIQYQIQPLERNTLKIDRILTNFNPKTYAIGQSLVYCADCIVTDSLNRAYFLKEFYTPEKENIVKSLNLDPVILETALLPKTLSKITVIDSEANFKFSTTVNPDQEVYLEQKWNILEFKTFITEQEAKNSSKLGGKVVISQIIYLDVQ